MADEQQALVIRDGVMTGTTVITGPWCKVKKSPKCSFQARWTNNPVGVFSFEVSNDENPNATTGDNQLAATALTLPASFAAGNPAGSASSFVFEFETYWAWIRPKYTNASGTGVLDMAYASKGGSG